MVSNKTPSLPTEKFEIQDMRINKMAPQEKALFAVKSHNLNSTFGTDTVEGKCLQKLVLYPHMC